MSRTKLVVAPARAPECAIDVATEKLAQAEALSFLLYGEKRGEAFRSLNDDIQDRVQWLLCRTIEDARAAVESLV